MTKHRIPGKRCIQPTVCSHSHRRGARYPGSRAVHLALPGRSPVPARALHRPKVIQQPKPRHSGWCRFSPLRKSATGPTLVGIWPYSSCTASSNPGNWPWSLAWGDRRSHNQLAVRIHYQLRVVAMLVAVLAGGHDAALGVREIVFALGLWPHGGHGNLPAVAGPRAPRLPAGPSRIGHPLLYPKPPPAAATPQSPRSAAPPPAACAHCSWPCACRRWRALWCSPAPRWPATPAPRSRASCTTATSTAPKSARCRHRNSKRVGCWGRFPPASTRKATSSSSFCARRQDDKTPSHNQDLHHHSGRIRQIP